MNEQHRLNVDYWKNKKIWEIDQIPYLFLGYEPVPHNYRPLDDVTTLDRQESERYYQYWRLIQEAIDLDELIPIKSSMAHTTPLKAADIKKWRKDVSYIKPSKIYLEMEEGIQESKSNDIEDSEISTSASTVKDEAACQHWLEKLMSNDSQQKENKSYYQEKALSKFKIGTRAFNRAWANAKTATGNTNWGKAGRRKS